MEKFADMRGIVLNQFPLRLTVVKNKKKAITRYKVSLLHISEVNVLTLQNTQYIKRK